MKITDINGDYLKISKNSMTVKDENGKTRGVIRNISALMSLSPGKIFEFYKRIKGFEDYENKVTRSGIFVCDNELYYLHNIHGNDFYNKQIAQFGKPILEEEYQRHMSHEKAVDKLRQSGVITVIDYREI